MVVKSYVVKLSRMSAGWMQLPHGRESCEAVRAANLVVRDARSDAGECNIELYSRVVSWRNEEIATYFNVSVVACGNGGRE